MSTTYRESVIGVRQDNGVLLQNDARTCETIDTRLTQRRSLKVLADQYEHGDASLKQSRGFYLRKMFKAVSA